MKENNLHFDYLYHYNPYNKKWACFCRDDYRNYFNGEKPIQKIGYGNSLEEAIQDKLNED
jgi:hypothetical protein